MTDPLQSLQSILQGGNLPVTNVLASSRYSRVGISTIENGKTRIYFKRRFIRTAPDIVTTEHRVKEGDRLDNLSAVYIGDPEQFWQIADVNNAFAPEQLTDVPGYKLRIP